MTTNRMVRLAWHIGVATVLAAAALAPTVAEAGFWRWVRIFYR